MDDNRTKTEYKLYGPATWKQEQFMRSNGLWNEHKRYSKEEASQIIGEFIATEATLRRLNRKYR